MPANDLDVFNGSVGPDDGLHLDASDQIHALGDLRIFRSHLYLDGPSSTITSISAMLGVGQREEF